MGTALVRPPRSGLVVALCAALVLAAALPVGSSAAAGRAHPRKCGTVVVHFLSISWSFQDIRATRTSCKTARHLLVAKTKGGTDVGIGGRAHGWTCKKATHTKRPFHFPGHCKRGSRRITYVYDDQQKPGR
jgi:hypothetical protein